MSRPFGRLFTRSSSDPVRTARGGRPVRQARGRGRRPRPSRDRSRRGRRASPPTGRRRSGSTWTSAGPRRRGVGRRRPSRVRSPRTCRRWRGRSPTRTSPVDPRRQGRRDGGGGRGPGAPRTGNGHDARGVPARPRRGELRARGAQRAVPRADVVGSEPEEAEGQLFVLTRTTAAESLAVALLAPLLDERVGKAGLRRLLDEVEAAAVVRCSRACRRTGVASTSSI